jgi:hypothetical protein
MTETIAFAGFEFARRKGPQTHVTENYVSSPPALHITDEAGDVWVLGMDSIISRGEFAFDVLRNGFPAGERANRIERRNGKISIFGPEGRKAWNGRSFV